MCKRTRSIFLIMAVWMCSCICYANPEMVTLKSALVWREDGKGDYLLPIPNSGIYEINEAVVTDGELSSITANWKSLGDFRLEVSANNGINYKPIVNGVPLTDFIRGNRLKWRATIGSEDAKLTEIKITYTDNSGVIGTFGAPQLSGFKFKKPIYIKGPSSELFNYQIKIKVGESDQAKGYDVHCAGNLKNDFQDICFTATDGETLLDYYLEGVSGNSPNKLAIFWVKVPQIPAEGVLLYMHYGKVGAKSLSDPKQTFDLFDDFNQTKLDTQIWEAYLGQDGKYSISNSQLDLQKAEIISKTFKLRGGIVEYSGSEETGLIIRKEKDTPDSVTTIQAAYSLNSAGYEHCITVGDLVKANDPKPITKETKYGYRITVKGSEIIFERYDTDFKELQAKVNYNDSEGLDSGYLGLKALGAGKARYDWIRVRQGVSESLQAEPAIDTQRTAQAAEETMDLPVFNDAKIAENGNLVLADNNQAGNYISKLLISSTLPIRIIVPSWKAKIPQDTGISVDISADKGETYKKDCVSGAYYYASKGDFSVGTNLKFKVGLTRTKEANEQNLNSELESISLDYRPGKIILISPNGGESWGVGTQKEISYSAMDYETTYPFKLEYSTDKGNSYTLITAQTENNAVYLWTVPAQISKEVIVKISDALDKNIYSASDKTFEIREVEEEDYLKKENTASWNNPESWRNSKVPGLNTDVVIANNITVYTEDAIEFRTLTIGDGTGKNKSKLILKNNIGSGSQEIIIRKGGELIVENNLPQVLAGNLTIKNGGILTHTQNLDTLKYKVDFSAENITVETGAKVSADGKGYTGGLAAQSGKGEAAGDARLLLAGAGVGGGYGGKGGKARNTENKAKNYGAKRQPQDLGSGGGGGWKTKGGAGAGMIRLNAQAQFNIYGSITANGEDGQEDLQGKYDGGGGAGGSIYLTAGRFGGERAVILALGGSGHKTGGGGGGGRIYVQGGGAITGGVMVNGGEGFETGLGGSIFFDK